MTTDGPVWEREGRDWPNREVSRFVRVDGLCWHVQRTGAGPVVLLIHGTGAATHSWRGLLPRLACDFDVVAVDLPGHGFTDAPPARQLSLNGMADALGRLLAQLAVSPELVVGHSAGAAILARMCLDRRIAPRALVSLNGALLPLRGLPGHLFAPAAKLFVALPLLPHFFAWRADMASVERLVASTGSSLDPEGMELYLRLVKNPGHVGSAVAMMANWDLTVLERELPTLQQRLFLVVGTNDGTVPPAEARRVHERLPAAELIELEGLGHLAHEERPEQVSELIGRIARVVGMTEDG